MEDYRRNTFSRGLDRVLVNHPFLDLYPTSKIQHLVRKGSDHASLHMICNTIRNHVIGTFGLFTSTLLY